MVLEIIQYSKWTLLLLVKLTTGHLKTNYEEQDRTILVTKFRKQLNLGDQN